jgi:lysophospholipase L1-like esterase
MIAALLPLLEGLAAEGGASAALGGGLGAEAGPGGAFGRMLGGGAQAFGSKHELGSALRQISDLHSTIKAQQEAIEAKRGQQEQIAGRAREDERTRMFADPGHTGQLADLARQQQQHADQMRRMQQELAALKSRAAVSTDPAAARASMFGQMSGTVGLIGAASAMLPQRHDPEKLGLLDYANPLKMMQHFWRKGTQGARNLGQAGSNAGQFVAGDLNSAIIRDGAGSLKQIFGDLARMKPTAVVRDLSELPAKLKGWGDALVESQRGISRFDGTLARMFAEQERRGVIRAVQSGQRTGGATSDLSDSLQRLADQIQPMRDTVTVVVAKGLTAGVTALSNLVDIVKGINAALKTLPGLGPAIAKVEGEIAKLTNETKKRREAPLSRAFEDALDRDAKKRIGIPRR